MAEKQLAGVRVAALTTDGVEQVELLEPKKALQDAGAEVTVVAPKRGTILGFKHWDKADSIPIAVTLDEADPTEYDAVLLPGGVINADALRLDKKAQAFVKEIDSQGRPIAVICHGPWLLVSAKLTRGRTLTSWPTLQDDIINSGGQWEDRQVLRDRNWVSSRKPDDIPAFNREIIKLFAEARQRKKAA